MGGGFNIWHILLIVAAFVLLFGGRGKISGIMGDTAKGIRAFRDGLKGEESADAKDAKSLPKDD